MRLYLSRKVHNSERFWNSNPTSPDAGGVIHLCFGSKLCSCFWFFSFSEKGLWNLNMTTEKRKIPL